MAAKVIGLAGDINLDGSYSVIVKRDNETFEMLIGENEMKQMVAAYQTSLIQRAHQDIKNVSIPVFAMNDVNIAHKGIETQLMVATLETGTVVLKATDYLLKKMKHEIDRVLTYRATPNAKN